MIRKAQNHYTLKPRTEIGAKKNAALEAALFDSFFPKLPRSSKILEIGSGRGEFAHECRSRDFIFLGIEPSQNLFQNLTKSGFEIINQAVPPIPTESELFDLVHSKHFVEHLSNYSEVMNFFLESYRVLKPGGYISVIAPNYRTIKHLFFQYEYQHSFITTKDRLKRMLMDSGYEIVSAFAFSLFISPRWHLIDRLLAHILIPLSINAITQGIIGSLISEEFLFRIHKTIYDHVAILGRKPI